MSNDELLSIKGGDFSASMINAIVRMGTLLLEIGRITGTIIKKGFNSLFNKG